MSVKITKIFKSVNSKPLVHEISHFVEEGLHEFGVQWDSEAQRETFIEIIEDFMSETADEGKIDSYKVICDRRNNTVTQNDTGVYRFDIYFKQKNCLNITQLLFTMTEVLEKDSITFDFVL